MKDYTIIANNENKTKINFEYDHGLLYKDRVKPAMEYGEWKQKPNKVLIKVNFNDDEMNLFENKNEIVCCDIYDLKDEYWIDLTDAYLIITKDNILEKKFNEKNIAIVFLHNNKVINALEI